MEDTKLKLAKLREEKLDTFKAKIAPELFSSGILLADYYTFVIKAIEEDKNSDDYQRIGTTNPSVSKYYFGYHESDINTNSFFYGIEDRLKESNTLVVWRLKDLSDYIEN